jgi:hypothetical protein
MACSKQQRPSMAAAPSSSKESSRTVPSHTSRPNRNTCSEQDPSHILHSYAVAPEHRSLQRGTFHLTQTRWSIHTFGKYTQQAETSCCLGPPAYGVRGGEGKREYGSPSPWRGLTILDGDDRCDRRARRLCRLVWGLVSKSMLSRLLLTL